MVQRWQHHRKTIDANGAPENNTITDGGSTTNCGTMHSKAIWIGSSSIVVYLSQASSPLKSTLRCWTNIPLISKNYHRHALWWCIPAPRVHQLYGFTEDDLVWADSCKTLIFNINVVDFDFQTIFLRDPTRTASGIQRSFTCTVPAYKIFVTGVYKFLSGVKILRFYTKTFIFYYFWGNS